MSNISYGPHSGQPEGAMMSASADDTTVHPKLSGRLDDPGRDLRTDPRLKPRLRAALAAFGLDAAAGPPPIDRTAAPEAIVEFVGESHAGFGGLYEALPNDLPGDDDSVEFSTDTVRGVDGNDITLRIYRSANVTGPLPCTVYIHGGGMTILDAFAKVHQRWCEDLAATGMVVIGVDFRNAYSAEGMHPFPAGLNDCTSALEWVNDHRGQLDITSVVLQGESGGANLVLATALKAKRDGHLDAINGVYAMVPYISGGYGWTDIRKLRELPSMIENDGYFINCAMMDVSTPRHLRQRVGSVARRRHGLLPQTHRGRRARPGPRQPRPHPRRRNDLPASRARGLLRDRARHQTIRRQPLGALTTPEDHPARRHLTAERTPWGHHMIRGKTYAKR